MGKDTLSNTYSQYLSDFVVIARRYNLYSWFPIVHDIHPSGQEIPYGVNLYRNYTKDEIDHEETHCWTPDDEEGA